MRVWVHCDEHSYWLTRFPVEGLPEFTAEIEEEEWIRYVKHAEAERKWQDRLGEMSRKAHE